MTDDVDALVRDVGEAADAFIRGDMRRYLELIHHSRDYTLMPPTGGVRRGFDTSPENVAALAAYFRDGEATLEVVETYAAGGLVVIAAVERQHGVVGDRPDADCSLRVTLVFRRTDDGTGGTGGWELVHRHADLLVDEVDLDRAVRARG